MSRREIPTGRLRSRPACEGLEPRALMSAVGSPHRAVAEVQALSSGRRAYSPSRSQVLSNLPVTPQVSASTSAPSGDLNPYGVAFVPPRFATGGPLRPGDVLVSNFNGPGGLQGTGTSIVRVTPTGSSTLFARTAAGTGLSTALGVLANRFIVVGNLPSTDGTAATAGAGSVLLLDRFGNKVAEYSNSTLVDGPWDLTIAPQSGGRASIFLANVLSGAITRVDVKVPARGNNVQIIGGTQIASGYAHRSDPAAFLLGPTGLAYDARSDTLYVASTVDNAVYAVRYASRTRVDGGTGSVIFNDQAHLHGPLGLAFAPNGNLIVANGDAINADPNQPNELVEFTTKGRFIGQLSVNATPGAAFGLALQSDGRGTRLAAVDDVLNQLDLFTAGRF